VPRARRIAEAGAVNEPLGDRLKTAFLKPPKPGSASAREEVLSVEELETLAKSANDKERLIGLLAAPWAAGVGLLITSSLINNDPPAHLADGAVNKLHVSVSLYHEAMLALVVLSIVMLVTAFFRKRLYLGMVMALYGLTVFNLHFWGFGIPFVMIGAWYLVRAYRFQRRLREARGDVPPRSSSSGSAVGRRARANSRYTPPISRSR
jgi:hypothetical protein